MTVGLVAARYSKYRAVCLLDDGPSEVSVKLEGVVWTWSYGACLTTSLHSLQENSNHLSYMRSIYPHGIKVS